MSMLILSYCVIFSVKIFLLIKIGFDVNVHFLNLMHQCLLLRRMQAEKRVFCRSNKLVEVLSQIYSIKINFFYKNSKGEMIGQRRTSDNDREKNSVINEDFKSDTKVQKMDNTEEITQVLLGENKSESDEFAV
ncbi:hypothetical protein BpHYR1_050952 [Brachionus plicatilis]|uniref:Uncharacterized protein n=1 Tax=Brachionus plicatilis TaxID=10195 RepID=A0A3M7QWW7_BRAPC|nr:hypothetical protein BpHYR1_050952 [Brachionus plicatilis]